MTFDDIQIWREAYRQLALSFMRTKGLSQGKLAHMMERASSDLTPYIGAKATPSRGDLNSPVNLKINTILGITEKDLAQLPGGHDPNSPYFVMEIDPVAIAMTNPAAHALTELMKQLLDVIPDPDVLTDLTRQMADREANRDDEAAQLNRQLSCAIEEARDAEVIELHNALVDLSRAVNARLTNDLHAQNRSDFQGFLQMARWVSLKGQYQDAIYYLGKALNVSEGVPENEVRPVRAQRDRLILSRAASFKDFGDAKAVLSEEYSPPYTWNIVSFEILISRADSFETARLTLTSAYCLGISPHITLFNLLIAKAEVLSEALEVRDQMLDAGITPTSQTFAMIISKAQSFKQAKGAFHEMRIAGYVPNLLCFRYYSSKVEDFHQAVEVLESMEKMGLEPDSSIYSHLIKTAGSYRQARLIFDRTAGFAQMRNLSVHNAMMEKVESISQATMVLDGIRDDGLFPNHTTIDSVLNLIESFDGAVDFFDEEIVRGAQVKLPNFLTLLSKAQSLEQALPLLKYMERAEVAPTSYFLNRLIFLADDFQKARLLFEKIAQQNWPFDEYTFSVLLSKTSSFDQVTYVMKNMGDLGVFPTAIFYNEAIKLAKTEGQANGIYRQMLQAGISPDLYVLTTLIHHSVGFGAAFVHFSTLLKSGLKPDSYVLDVIVRKAPSYKIALSLIQGMRTKMDVQPDIRTYCRLLSLANSPVEAQKAAELMLQDQVSLDSRTLKTLQKKRMWHEIDEFDARQLIKR